MRRLLGRSPRLAGLAAAGLCTAAVLLGHRYRPAGERPTPEVHSPAVPRYAGVSHFFQADGRRLPRRVLDVETGGLAACTIADPGLLDVIGCSPWRDRDGQFHLICRTMEAEPGPRGLPAEEIVLARCTYPAGRVLGRVALDRMPHGSVCWSPDGGDRILFAAYDGRLYRHDLPRRGWPGTPTATPRPIRWRCGCPEEGNVFLREPCWPAGPYPGGWLLASMQTRTDASQRFSSLRLRWLKPDRSGDAVVESRPAFAPPAEDPVAAEEERLPTVAPASDGAWQIAYLARHFDRSTWELWATPLEDGVVETGPRPVSRGRRVAAGCLAMAPAFSPDGRWVHAAMADGRGGIRIERWSVRQLEDVPSDPMPTRCCGVLGAALRDWHDLANRRAHSEGDTGRRPTARHVSRRDPE